MFLSHCSLCSDKVVQDSPQWRHRWVWGQKLVNKWINCPMEGASVRCRASGGYPEANHFANTLMKACVVAKGSHHGRSHSSCWGLLIGRTKPTGLPGEACWWRGKPAAAFTNHGLMDAVRECECVRVCVWGGGTGCIWWLVKSGNKAK